MSPVLDSGAIGGAKLPQLANGGSFITQSEPPAGKCIRPSTKPIDPINREIFNGQETSDYQGDANTKESVS